MSSSHHHVVDEKYFKSFIALYLIESLNKLNITASYQTKVHKTYKALFIQAEI